MEAWLKRVIDEKAELDEKIEKLAVYLDSDPPISPAALLLLHKQFWIMNLYSEVLEDRIRTAKYT